MAKKPFLTNGWVIGIGTAVLGTLVLRGIDSIADTKILSGIWNFTKSTFSFLSHKYTLPLWIIILFCFSGLGLLILIAWLANLFSSKPIGNTEPDWLEYTADTFETAYLFRWQYQLSNRTYTAINIQYYCPKDNCQIVYNKCPVCNNFFATQAINDDTIRALIKHKVENNLWKQSVQRFKT
jgi:hypothetical protein